MLFLKNIYTFAAVFKSFKILIYTEGWRD